MARGELPVGGHQGIIHIRPQPDQRCAVRERLDLTIFDHLEEELVDRNWRLSV